MPFAKNLSSRHILALAEASLQCGFVQITPQAAEVVLSTGLQALLGLQSKGSHVSFMDLEGVIHADDRQSFRDDVAIVRNGGIPPERQFRVVRATGSLRYIRVTFEALADVNGQIRRLIGIVRDVTQEETLRTARATMQRQLEALKQALQIESIWTCAPSEGLFDHYSATSPQRAGEMTLDKAGWFEAVHPDDLRHMMAEWSRCFLEKSPLAVAVRLLGADGQTRRYVSRVCPILNEVGDVAEWQGVLIEDPHPGRLHHYVESAPAAIVDIANGVLVRAVRGALGWTVGELSGRAGLSRTTIRRMEATITPLVAIAKRKTVERLLVYLAEAGVGFVTSVDGKIGFYCLPQEEHTQK